MESLAARGYLPSMTDVESSPRGVVVDSVTKTFRLESIKSRVVGLALLATLVPSLAMAWISYVQNRSAVTEKISEELQSVSTQTARELDLWFKERVFDVQVFASSFQVAENVEGARRPAEAVRAVTRLNDYLASVGDRFPDYDELMVVDGAGELLGSSAERAGEIHLPPGWLDRVASGEVVVADEYWDEQVGRPLMTVAVPINGADRTFLGAFVTNVSYRPVLTILLVFAPGDSGNLYVIGSDGSTIVSLRADERPVAERKLGSLTTALLYENEGSPVRYTDRDGTEVVGTLKRVPRLDWAVVAEITEEEAYAQVVRLRDLTVLLVTGILLVVGFTAFRLGLLIVGPLDRLTRGAAEVAAGDFAVDLPVGKGEAGYLTEVFNDMVARLREGRHQLEQLLVTDPLTGVSNRRHLMETLEKETRRSARSGRPFALLMVDVDQFKKFNDLYGHIVGDEALTAVAGVLRFVMREADHVARYGGEEFMVILPDTDVAGGVLAAERVREQLSEHILSVGNGAARVTVSTGVAEFPVDGSTPEELIASADAALYRAKRSGRDRVMQASRQTKAQKTTESTTEGTATDKEWTEGEKTPSGALTVATTLKKTTATAKKNPPTTKGKGRKENPTAKKGES